MKIRVPSEASSAAAAPQIELTAADASLLLDLLPTMAWTATPDGSVEFVNQQCAAFTGLPRERLLGDGMAECIHPEDRHLRQKAQAQAQLSEARPFECEFRLRSHDGQYTRCVARVVPMRDRAGRVIRWVGTTVDIEEMRRATDRLIQEEHLRLALESADVGIWRLKLPSYELTVDERTRRHLDLDRNVIPRYDPQAVIHPEDFARAATILPNAHGRYATEHRVKQRDGTYRWQAIHWRHWSENADNQGASVLVTGTSMDVTARKQAEAEREELGKRYSIALDAAELGTLSCDLDAGLLHLDDRARAHFQVAQSTLTYEQCLGRVYEPDRQRAFEKIRQQLVELPHKNRASIEFRVAQADGALRWISSQLYATFSADDAGRPVSITGVTRDITEVKQAVETVRRLNTDLERRVQQRTAELRAANEELESFAYTVSHDLRAPLRAMWGFCDALIEDHGASLPAPAHEYLQHVIEGSRHLGDIIDGLLTLARSTRGTLRRDLVDLSGLAEKAMRDMARIEPHRRVTWTIEPGLSARGDSRMIDAALRNLLGNAWKYTANRANALIRVYGEHVDGAYVFCVADNGAGFNMEHAEKLFQPFQRLHRQDEFSGLGIGLATVQRIIHRHGGKVSGTGAPGQGAIFRFSLPLPDEAAEREREQ